MRAFFVSILCLALILITTLGCDGTRTVCPKIGDKSPDFSLMDMDGNNVNIADFAGRPIIINTWSVDCIRCKEEMPFFSEVIKNFNSNELVFLSVNTLDGTNTIKDFLSKNGYTFTVLRDYGRKTINNRFCFPGSGPSSGDPYTIFINNKGFIQNIKIGGFTSTDELMAEVNKILSAK